MNSAVTREAPRDFPVEDGDGKGYRKLDRWWRPYEVRMLHHHTRRQTLLRWRTRELGRHYPHEDFSRLTVAAWVLENAIFEWPPPR